MRALAYLQEQRIMHRDVKSSNVLVTNSLVLKLADFGMARQLQEGVEAAVLRSYCPGRGPPLHPAAAALQQFSSSSSADAFREDFTNNVSADNNNVVFPLQQSDVDGDVWWSNIVHPQNCDGRLSRFGIARPNCFWEKRNICEFFFLFSVSLFLPVCQIRCCIYSFICSFNLFLFLSLYTMCCQVACCGRVECRLRPGRAGAP
jgi:serine/threonine protein kinase